jgi:hypothetical protein
MPQKDKRNRKEYSQRYHQEHIDEIHRRQREYYLKNRERLLQKRRAYLKEHREQRQKYNRTYNQKIKVEVLTHYGKGRLACVVCGEVRLDCLSIDHINNDGAIHRKAIGTGTSLYHWLKQNDYPEGYQTLCMNCQWLKKKGKRQ